MGIAWETVGVVEQIEHRADHKRAGDDADDERDLLAPRRGADELPVFRSCRLSFEIVAIENTIATAKSAKRHQRISSALAQNGLCKAASSSEPMTIDRMPIPETGLF